MRKYDVVPRMMDVVAYCWSFFFCLQRVTYCTEYEMRIVVQSFGVSV